MKTLRVCVVGGIPVPEGERNRGGGAALLFRCLESMREMGYAYAVIGGVGPEEYYQTLCGAVVIPGSETGVYESLHRLRGGES